MAETSTSAELIESDAHLASACEHFRELIQSPSIVADLVVGLDCEWRPPSGSVSVLQIATSTRCFIIRTQQCIASLPMLSELLANKSIVKVGVGVGDDAAKLNRDFGISVRGCVDLRSIAARCEFSNLASSGLRAIVQASCSVDLKKDASIQCSNWDEPLSAAQIDYAAADAIYSHRAFLYFFHSMRERNLTRKCAPLSTGRDEISGVVHPAADSVSSSAHPADHGLLFSFIQGLVDVAIPVTRPLSQSSTQISSANSAAASSSPRAVAKSVRRSEFWKTHARKSNLYENCRILAPCGLLMCNANKKKLLWYLERGLADEIDDSTIRLKFEPKGLGHAGDQFYLESKQNACVSCGASDQVVRHSIVPHSFRTHFPESFKSHSSHDIVLLCPTCLQAIGAPNDKLRKELFAEANVQAGFS